MITPRQNLTLHPPNIKKRFKDQLHEQNVDDAYRVMAELMGYDVLGQAPNTEFEVFYENPGTLAERIWERCPWSKPPDETCSCWWIANAADVDRSRPVQLICKSLAVLRLEVHASRCATSGKLRQEKERRTENNALAVDVLYNNQHLWRHVGGPEPELLLHPSESDFAEAQAAVERMHQMVEAHGPTEDGLDIFSKEISAAVASIKFVTWEAMRRERFTLTPMGLYDELVQNAESLLRFRDAESARRQERLSRTADNDDSGTEHETETSPKSTSKDKYLNLEEFKCKSSRKPHRWQTA
eukprot:12422828-Karenia_brevis.AAC.1